MKTVNFLDAHREEGYIRLTEERVTPLYSRALDFPYRQRLASTLFEHPNDHQCDSRVLCNKESQTPSGPEGSSGRDTLYVCRGARLSFFQRDVVSFTSN